MFLDMPLACLTLQLVIMDNFVYYAPTKFVFGRYTEKRIGELAKEFGGTRALVVYGGGSAVRSGAVGRAVRSLHAAGFDTFNLEGIQPNPADDRVREGIELVRMHDIDIIIAVGGGSVIDTAKAIALGALYDGDFGISIVERLRLSVLCRSEWCLPYRLPAAKARAIR